MRPDGSLDFAAWAKLLDFHAANGTSGIVVGGTSGESATLSDAEMLELTERACAQPGEVLRAAETSAPGRRGR